MIASIPKNLARPRQRERDLLIWGIGFRTTSNWGLAFRNFTGGLCLFLYSLSICSCAYLGAGTSKNTQLKDRIFLRAQGKNFGFNVAFKEEELSSEDRERKLKVLVSNRSLSRVVISSSYVSRRQGGDRGSARLWLKTGESGVLLTTSAAELVQSWGEIYVSGNFKDSLDVELVFDWLDGGGAPAGLMYNYTKIVPGL